MRASAPSTLRSASSKATGSSPNARSASGGKPARKVYSITERGREALLGHLGEPPREDVFRSEFLMVAMCAHQLDRDTVDPRH